MRHLWVIIIVGLVPFLFVVKAEPRTTWETGLGKREERGPLNRGLVDAAMVDSKNQWRRAKSKPQDSGEEGTDKSHKSSKKKKANSNKMSRSKLKQGSKGGKKEKSVKKKSGKGGGGMMMDNTVAPVPSAAPSPAPEAQNRTFVFQVGNLQGNASQTGTIKIQTMLDWAPIGVRRFHDLILSDFYTGCRFFRVLPGFVVQFGINGDPDIQSSWNERFILDDPVKASNLRGTLSFALAGPDTRTTQLFFNLVDNSRLDALNFAPFATVIEGMDVVDRLYSEWRELPDQREIIAQGNAYLDINFPGLSYIISAQPTLD